MDLHLLRGGLQWLGQGPGHLSLAVGKLVWVLRDVRAGRPGGTSGVPRMVASRAVAGRTGGSSNGAQGRAYVDAACRRKPTGTHKGNK